MSSASDALQDALIDVLMSSEIVASYLGERIFDNSPDDAEYPYLALGPAQEIDDSADCISGSECFQQIDIWTQDGGSQRSAKQICGAVKKALKVADLEVSGPYAVLLVEVGGWRVISDRDEQVTHGIINVRALVEEF
nr:DUF3168 domain-containing protein [uncultured Celeribacter sp.]